MIKIQQNLKLRLQKKKKDPGFLNSTFIIYYTFWKKIKKEKVFTSSSIVVIE